MPFLSDEIGIEIEIAERIEAISNELRVLASELRRDMPFVGIQGNLHRLIHELIIAQEAGKAVQANDIELASRFLQVGDSFINEGRHHEQEVDFVKSAATRSR
jgi:hypothetical protein